jgi:hypothetical protein
MDIYYELSLLSDEINPYIDLPYHTSNITGKSFFDELQEIMTSHQDVLSGNKPCEHNEEFEDVSIMNIPSESTDNKPNLSTDEYILCTTDLTHVLCTADRNPIMCSYLHSDEYIMCRLDLNEVRSIMCSYLHEHTYNKTLYSDGHTCKNESVTSYDYHHQKLPSHMHSIDVWLYHCFYVS